jgi:tetratricopeptide (TPR) repeat protein/sugar lactone lactonase YvrE
MHRFTKHILHSLVLSCTLSPLATHAAPTLVDSIAAAQLPGVKVKSISSLYADNGTLWVTDTSNQVFQWKLGDTPEPVISGGKKQKFTSVLPIGDSRAVVTDFTNHQFLIGTDGDWKAFATEGELEGQLDEPIASAWSDDGILYIAEAGNERISAFTDTGLFLFTFGNNAPKNEEDDNLGNILGLSIDQQGRIYVLDDENGGRISIYSVLGELDTILSKDEFAAIIPDPLRLLAMTVRPDGVLLLADKKSGHIYEIDWENMEVLSTFATVGKGRGQLQKVSALALDNDGRLYVADSGNDKIEVFKLDGEQTPWLKPNADRLSIYPSSVLTSGCNVSYIYDAKTMLCINSKKDTVSLRAHDGTLIQKLESKFNEPIRAAFDKQGIFVLDRVGVHVFDTQGTFKFTFGSKGRRDGELSQPAALTITPQAVYIADTGNSRVQVFSRNGLFQKAFGNNKNDNIKLDEPTAIAVDKRGLVYVVDTELNKVFIYTAKGELKGQIGENEGHPLAFTKLYDVMVDEHDTLYVLASMENNPLSVWMYQDGQMIYRFSPEKQAAQAGIDAQWASAFINHEQDVASLKKAAKEAVAQIAKLSIDPNDEIFAAKGGFFGGGDNDWMFNHIPTNNSAFALVNLGAHARYTFNVQRAPKQINNVLLAGDEESLDMQWVSPSPTFSGYYRVYGRNNISAPFKQLAETIAAKKQGQRKHIQATEYRVSAVSPYGKESQLSPVFQDNFWLGYQAYQGDNFDSAYDALIQAAQNNPSHAAAWLYLGKTQLRLGKADDAVSTFKQIASFDAYKQQGLHLQAQALMEKQAWLDVKSLVDDSESKGDADATLYSLAASALIVMDDIPSAIYYLDQAVALEPASALWHLKLADANFELGAEDNAKTELIKASQLAGKDVDAWLNVARTYKKHQLFGQAVSGYDSALLIESNHEQALSELAVLHLEQGNLEKSRGLATKMAGIPALKGTSYYILGRIALAEDKAPQALAMLAKAGQTEPNNANIWLAMADAYAKINKPRREQEYLKKAAALDDDNFDVHIRLAKSCEAKNDVPCMLTNYERAASIDDKNIGAQIGYAKALMQSGNMNKADTVAHHALKLNPSSIPAHIVLADIQNARGMIRDSIATLKKAMTMDDTNMDVHLSLAKAYIGNHMYDEAIAITEKASLLDIRNADPLVLTGSIYLARQSFDKAISSLEKAVELAPDNAKYRQQLNLAYLQKKRSVDAGGNLLGPKLKQLDYNRVFSAAYKQYTDVPVGTLILKNEAGIDYSNVKISLLVKEYMDFPTTAVVERIAAGAEVEVPLLAAFNNRILDIDEDTGVQTEVRAEYYMAGKPHVETLNAPLTIYGKNAIVWDKLDMVGSFATPKDDTLAVFTRQLINAYNPQKGALNQNVAKAMTVFNGFSAYGIKYLLDPNTPYDQLGSDQLDTVQFPRETLRQRSGDCDDLSILLASALANLGIETAILDVPQHLLMMFNTGVSEAQKDLISSNDEALAIIDGKVWVPVEATLIAASFTEAWAEGARKYHLYGKQAKMKIMPLAIAWQNYPPVTLPPADFAVDIPSKEILGAKIEKEWEILSIKALERQVRPYRMMLALDPNNTEAKMQIAIVYAQSGLYNQANQELQSILAHDDENLAALNNIGNIYFLQQNYKNALSMYEKALDVEPDPNIMVNIAMVDYKMGDAVKAKAMFEQATQADEQVPTRYKAFALLLKQ